MYLIKGFQYRYILKKDFHVVFELVYLKFQLDTGIGLSGVYVPCLDWEFSKDFEPVEPKWKLFYRFKGKESIKHLLTDLLSVMD